MLKIRGPNWPYEKKNRHLQHSSAKNQPNACISELNNGVKMIILTNSEREHAYMQPADACPFAFSHRLMSNITTNMTDV